MLIIHIFFADRGLRSGWAKLMGVASRADMFLMNRAPSCSNYIKMLHHKVQQNGQGS